MAKINPMTHIDSMQGKYSKSDRVYTRVRKFDELTIGIRLKHPATNEPPTTAQQAVQDLFTTVASKVKTALADASQRAQYKADWKKQKKYKTLTSYVFHKLYEAETANP